MPANTKQTCLYVCLFFSKKEWALNLTRQFVSADPGYFPRKVLLTIPDIFDKVIEQSVRVQVSLRLAPWGMFTPDVYTWWDSGCVEDRTQYFRIEMMCLHLFFSRFGGSLLLMLIPYIYVILYLNATVIILHSNTNLGDHILNSTTQRPYYSHTCRSLTKWGYSLNTHAQHHKHCIFTDRNTLLFDKWLNTQTNS